MFAYVYGGRSRRGVRAACEGICEEPGEAAASDAETGTCGGKNLLNWHVEHCCQGILFPLLTSPYGLSIIHDVQQTIHIKQRKSGFGNRKKFKEVFSPLAYPGYDWMSMAACSCMEHVESDAEEFS